MFYDTVVLLLHTALTQSMQRCSKRLWFSLSTQLNDQFAVKMKAKMKTSHLSIAVNELRYFIRLHYFHQKQHMKTFPSTIKNVSTCNLQSCYYTYTSTSQSDAFECQTHPSLKTFPGPVECPCSLNTKVFSHR